MARVVVLGRSGTGKSYFAGYLLEQAVPKFNLAVHFDIEDEEVGLSDRNSDPLYKTLRVDRATAEKINWMKAIYRHKKLRVVPESMTEAEMRALYAEICRVTMKLCKKKKPELTAFLSCDEAHNILKQSDFPTRVERMITGGRKHGVEALHISQRPPLLHTTLIAMADKRVYFGTSEKNDIRTIDNTANFDANRLKSLESRRCIIENKDTGEWTEVDTDGIDRRRPHYSGDDGIIDGALPV